jgi:EmrB/QacA subfamily drug resistance transporter
MAGSLGSDIATIQWVVTLYLLVVSGLLLSFGRLGDLRGHKAVYVTGFVVFVLGSALCGLAATADALIACRALQAVGAAMLFANSPAILTRNFPPAQRGQALGLRATLTYLGQMVGPFLGGWLAVQFSWRAVFYINVPVGLLALLLSLRFIPRDAAADHAERFDVAGALTFMVGLVALLLGLNQGHALGWTSPPILILLALAGLVLAAFVAVERRVPYPMLDLGLFRRRLFSAAAASAVLNFLCVYGILFLLPFYLIQGRDLSPAQAGLLLTMQPLVMIVVAPLSGTLSDRIGSRLPATLGMAILAVALFLLSRLGPHSSVGDVVVPLAIAGLGTGIFISPNNSALMGAAPRHQQGIAAGILATARNVGMMLGVGLVGAIFTTVLAQGEVICPPTALFGAVDAGFLVATGAAILGGLISVVRER